MKEVFESFAKNNTLGSEKQTLLFLLLLCQSHPFATRDNVPTYLYETKMEKNIYTTHKS